MEITETNEAEERPLSQRIRDLEANSGLEVRDGNVASVQATVSRIRTEFPSRDYITKKRGDIVKVWRFA